MKSFLILFLIALLLPLGIGKVAEARICDSSSEYCGDWGGNSSSATNSVNRGGKIRINPAVIPVGKGLGIELLYFDGSVDFSLVKGLGRIGAAISPSNSEETFFGPPGFEYPTDLSARKQGHHKYPGQKMTLATAFGLFDNHKSGMSRLSLNLGVMGKYNKITGAINPGLGLAGVIGPLTFGYSRYGDQTFVTDPFVGSPAGDSTLLYNVETISVGAYIDFLAIDYSMLKVIPDNASSPSTVSVATATVLLKKALITVAMRTEKIQGFTYNYDISAVEIVDTKVEYFGGVQIAVGSPLLLGVFYNYYLVRDISFGATVFF